MPPPSSRGCYSEKRLSVDRPNIQSKSRPTTPQPPGLDLHQPVFCVFVLFPPPIRSISSNVHSLSVPSPRPAVLTPIRGLGHIFAHTSMCRVSVSVDLERDRQTDTSGSNSTPRPTLTATASTSIIANTNTNLNPKSNTNAVQLV